MKEYQLLDITLESTVSIRMYIFKYFYIFCIQLIRVIFIPEHLHHDIYAQNI